MDTIIAEGNLKFGKCKNKFIEVSKQFNISLAKYPESVLENSIGSYFFSLI